MTHAEFLKANLNKKLDYDKQFGGQCVDLMRFYVRDVLKGDSRSPGLGLVIDKESYRLSIRVLIDKPYFVKLSIRILSIRNVP